MKTRSLPIFLHVSAPAPFARDGVAGALESGDGQPRTPALTVKGGDSGFYSIKVVK